MNHNYYSYRKLFLLRVRKRCLADAWRIISRSYCETWYYHEKKYSLIHLWAISMNVIFIICIIIIFFTAKLFFKQCNHCIVMFRETLIRNLSVIYFGCYHTFKTVVIYLILVPTVFLQCAIIMTIQHLFHYWSSNLSFSSFHRCQPSTLTAVSTPSSTTPSGRAS